VPIAFPLTVGASISINGVCSTVKKYKNNHENNHITVDYLPETLKKTTLGQLQEGIIVNIESPLKYGDEIGGHIVTGHIDTVGTIKDIKNQGDFHQLTIEYPSEYAPNLISKGSIAIDGISLTVVMDDNTATTQFNVHIIPHTWVHTNLHMLSIGNKVNLEFDQAGKYASRRCVINN
jgi:riboflavin synthase